MWASFFLQNSILFFVFGIMLTIALILKIDTKMILGKNFSHLKFITTELKILNKNNSLKVSIMANNRIINFTRPILKKKFVVSIQNKLNYELETDVRSSGRAANPRTLAMQGMAYMFVSILIVIPIAILLAIIVEPIFFLMLIIPPILALYPKIKLKSAKVERRVAIDDEIAFFTMYASVMQTIGKSFYTSILEIVGKGIFPTIETESKMLDRNIRLFGMDPITALNSHGITHPNLHFRNLLLGYVSISKSGGDLGQFMERKSDEFFTHTKFKFSKYTKQSEIIGELMLILLNILPILLMTSSFLMAGESILIIMSISFIVVPVTTALMIIIINSFQPKTKDNVKFSIFSILFGGIAALIAIVMNQPHWVLLVVPVSITAICNHIATSYQFREISMIESALPDFFRDVTEYRKIGIAIPNALIKIANQRSYNHYFDSLLSKIATNLSLGNDLNKILESIVIRSWLGRTSFFVLGKIAGSGGGTPEILEQMTDFSGKIKEAKNEMMNGLQIFSYMAHVSPLLMILSASGMKDVMTKIGPGVQQLMQSEMNGMAITSEFLGIVNLLIIICSFCMGLIMSKITYFTMKHTMTVGISSTIAMILIFAAPHMPSLIK
jgi:flagellar protein FlaJ